MEMLPLKLADAIDCELGSVQPDLLRAACFDLSQRYRVGQFIETQIHRQAYMATRLPATYGATRHIFRRIEPFLNSITSLIDLGAGMGALAWAAAEAMSNLKRITLFEKDIEMLRMGQHLAQSHLFPFEMAWCRENITQSLSFPPHDAVVLSYVLNELSLKEQIQVINRAYEAADKLLILIEPGTPKGYSHILTARTLLLEKGAHILAPCPHNKICPLATLKESKEWCHFKVRIPRGKYHRRAKEASLPYEDEKYSYLVLTPKGQRIPEDRIIKAPIIKTGHIIIDLCRKTGDIDRRILSKSEGKIYAQARDAEWGDEWKE